MRFAARILLLALGSVAAATALVAAPAQADEPIGPREVRIGAYVDNIQTVDLATNSFSADIYVWLRWSNPALEPWKGLAVMNPFEKWALSATPLSDEPVVDSDGYYYWGVQYQGSFNAPMSVAQYPFEEVTLEVIFEDPGRSREELVFVPDEAEVAIDPTITLHGYDFGSPTLEIADFSYVTDFGEPDTTPLDFTYSRATLRIPLASPLVSGVIKFIAPILLVVVTAGLAFLVPARHVEARIGIAMTALLTLVAMQWGATADMPDVNYLTMLDLLYVLAYAFAVACVAGTVYTAWIFKAGDEDLAMRRDHQALTVLSIGYVVLLIVVLAVYLVPG